MRKVYTYRSITSLREHPCFKEIQKYPQFTATSDLLLAMRKNYSDIKLLDLFYTLQKGFCRSWLSYDVQLQQFLNLSRIIRLLPVSDQEKNVHASFIKNKTSVLEAIRSLTEACVFPEDIQAETIEESLFKRIWSQLDIEDDSLSELQAEFQVYQENPAHFRSMLLRICPYLTSDTIVMHGFFYINPIQERIMDLLENCGKKLIFLCCIDDRVPEADAIWHHSLTEHNRFDSPEKWISDNPVSMPNLAFGSVFGNQPTFCSLPNIKIIEYPSEIGFIQDVNRILKENRTIFSSKNKDADALLKDFYPDIYKRRHLLSYPVGQFVYRLHKMWNAQNQRLELTIEDIEACFASGWVECNGINGLDYVDKLEDLKTYFTNCKTVQDWEARMDLLLQVKSSVLSPFESHISDIPSSKQQWHKMMADPFLNFSCFKHSEAVLGTLIGLIRSLLSTAKYLFSTSSEISIILHLQKLQKIISRKSSEDRLLQEEKVILEELYSRINNPHLNIRQCLPGEISEALMLIIGGGILDEDNQELSAGTNDNLIKPLSQIESAPILSDQKIHLCLADETRLPGSRRPYPWPLNHSMLDRLSISHTERRYQYLYDLCYVADNLPLSVRYLFYSLLQNKDVELSWIDTEDGKTIASSPYIQILNLMFNVPIQVYRNNHWTFDTVKGIQGAHSPTQIDIPLFNDLPSEPLLDAALCPWRYVYGYILSEFPAYSSDFHYGFILSNLISALVNVSKLPKKQIADEVFELFPYLREVEKRQLLDYCPYIKDAETDSLDNVSYPSARLYPHFLNRKILDDAKCNLDSILESGAGKHTAGLINTGEYTLCMYCPHNTTCPHGKHDVREAD